MHVDLNSCFATIEQQANPLIRGKPTVVAAYTTGNGCILAPSREAKTLGIKTGMRVRDGKALCPRLVVLPPDPEKYRWVNRKLQALLASYTPHLSVESIDEMVLKMPNDTCQMIHVAKEIKQRIRKEIGEWLTVSIGIAPNRYLAKVASGLHKPDGLDVITKETIEETLASIQLEDLCGIKEGNAMRLRRAGIMTPVDFYRASPIALVNALHSKTGWDWWLRLHGYEDGGMYKSFEEPPDLPKTFGQSFALGTARVPSDPEIVKIMAQLIVKMGRRMRRAGFIAHGISVSLLFTGYTHWAKAMRCREPLFADADFLAFARQLLATAPTKYVRIIAVTSFNLIPRGTGQMPIWNTDARKWRLTETLDRIANRWGEFTVTPGRMLSMEQKVLDRIAFGRVRELQCNQ